MVTWSYVETLVKKPDSFKVDSSMMDGTKIWFHREKIRNRYINYYMQERTGINKVLNGQHYLLFLFLPPKAHDFINLVNKLGTRNCSVKELKKTFRNFPYIINASYLWLVSCYDEKEGFWGDIFKEEIESFHKKHPETNNTITPAYGYVVGVSEIGERYAVTCHFSKDSINSQDKQDALIAAIQYADNLMWEIMNVRINFDKLLLKIDNQNQTYEIPPFLKKAAIYSGVYAVKFAARMIGSDFNANFDINVDVPDIPDFGGFDLASTNFEFDADFDTDIDFNSDFDTGSLYSGDFDTSDYNDTSNSGYNVSFHGQDAVLHTPGDGQHLEATITKEPGSSNTFTIKTDKGTVSGVPGNASRVRINGIQYILPRLKG